ncbi:quinone-dependent dihydroorotate dehydrogenase [Altericista sp. CCNU0014]|uniref:quinone-dependent dihydroorotate dehydrogenase n=1 Tax=Altericista sp. CCNU0014 TaxID=3082949 RepID=UPI00384C8BDA
MDIYQFALRPLMFSGLKVDPETVHRQFMELCDRLERNCDRPWGRWTLQQIYSRLGWTDARLNQTLWGLSFPNPIGLAAGFDKDGAASNVWPAFGFGFAELGTVTRHAQPGNPQPRLFRLPADEAAINRMGFNNKGAARMAEVLAASQCRSAALDRVGLPTVPIGINLGKSKITPLEDAVGDYCESFRLLRDFGDYGVVNVSSPNTPGLRSLQSVAQLEPILSALQQENPLRKPILVKIAPDLVWEDVAAIADLVRRYSLAGMIATNTTLSREGLKTERLLATGRSPLEEAGGLSGAPLRARSTEVIRFIWDSTQGTVPIVGVGGVFTARDAWEKLAAGSSLVQVYTGWTYEGPWMVRRILEGLVRSLQLHQLHHISEAVGTGLPYRAS